MERISKRMRLFAVVIVLFAAGLIILMINFAAHGAEWATKRINSHIYAQGQINTAGGIYDRNGTPLAVTKDGKRVFSGDKTTRVATLHAVGDLEGFISTGAHTNFRNELTGYSSINGVYSLLKYGKGNDIKLSIDAALCKTAYQALDGKNGTIGVYNYKTGEVLCMVSTPSYDPNHKPENIDGNSKYEAVYLNRFLHGLFTPGSTFKIVTAACALKHLPQVQSRTFTCTGEYNTGDGVVICRTKHGEISFEEALNVSCNSAFAQLAIELGTERLRATAQTMGFNKAISVERMPLAMSQFSMGEMKSLELGWAGVGQHTTLANPAQMLILMGAIANGGQGVLPKLASERITASGKIQPFRLLESKPLTAIALEPQIAATLKTMLRSNVTNTYDERGDYDDLQLCGKTGTAEVDNKKPHAWFVGFCANPATPYAIVTVAENAGSGQDVAYKAAAKVLLFLKKK